MGENTFRSCQTSSFSSWRVPKRPHPGKQRSRSSDVLERTRRQITSDVIFQLVESLSNLLQEHDVHIHHMCQSEHAFKSRWTSSFSSKSAEATSSSELRRPWPLRVPKRPRHQITSDVVYQFLTSA
ncbi:hypothetical protein Taro_032621 [Colocasia esculenta]|uniref:Uncharacterized protein n=1 Tax=Colocasia esculenta TaxID=4460 RepID=A0A843VXS8_COLES|nr:hypothetical protein [Colocasia esculenta]